ncbi:MAG: hypothetical protein NC930_02655, partial [Candidatus Omnitrophica bacterium]|nr:hypothetical protein [Candidatus Omnitrophota bacterium]
FNDYVKLLDLDPLFAEIMERVYGPEFFKVHGMGLGGYLELFLEGGATNTFKINSNGELQINDANREQFKALLTWLKTRIEMQSLPLEFHRHIKRTLDLIKLVEDAKAGDQKFSELVTQINRMSANGEWFGYVDPEMMLRNVNNPDMLLARFHGDLVAWTSQMVLSYWINVRMAWISAVRAQMPAASSAAIADVLKERLEAIKEILTKRPGETESPIEGFYGRSFNLVDPTFHDPAILTRLVEDYLAEGYNKEDIRNILILAKELKERKGLGEHTRRYVYRLKGGQEKWDDVKDKSVAQLFVERDRTAPVAMQHTQMVDAPFNSGILLAEAKVIYDGRGIRTPFEALKEYEKIITGKYELLEHIQALPAGDPNADPLALVIRLVNLLNEKFSPAGWQKIPEDTPYRNLPPTVQGYFQAFLQLAVRDAVLSGHPERSKDNYAGYVEEHRFLVEELLTDAMKADGDQKYQVSLKNLQGVGKTLPAIQWVLIKFLQTLPETEYQLSELFMDQTINDVGPVELGGAAPRGTDEVNLIRRMRRHEQLESGEVKRVQEISNLQEIVQLMDRVQKDIFKERKYQNKYYSFWFEKVVKELMEKYPDLQTKYPNVYRRLFPPLIDEEPAAPKTSALQSPFGMTAVGLVIGAHAAKFSKEVLSQRPMSRLYALTMGLFGADRARSEVRNKDRKEYAEFVNELKILAKQYDQIELQKFSLTLVRLTAQLQKLDRIFKKRLFGKQPKESGVLQKAKAAIEELKRRCWIKWQRVIKQSSSAIQNQGLDEGLTYLQHLKEGLQVFQQLFARNSEEARQIQIAQSYVQRLMEEAERRKSVAVPPTAQRAPPSQETVQPPAGQTIAQQPPVADTPPPTTAALSSAPKTPEPTRPGVTEESSSRIGMILGQILSLALLFVPPVIFTVGYLISQATDYWMDVYEKSSVKAAIDTPFVPIRSDDQSFQEVEPSLPTPPEAPIRPPVQPELKLEPKPEPQAPSVPPVPEAAMPSTPPTAPSAAPKLPTSPAEAAKPPVQPAVPEVVDIAKYADELIASHSEYFKEGRGLVRVRFTWDGKDYDALVPVDRISLQGGTIKSYPYTQPWTMALAVKLFGDQIEGDLPKTVDDPLLEMEKLIHFLRYVRGTYPVTPWLTLNPPQRDSRPGVGIEDLDQYVAQLAGSIGSLREAQGREANPDRRQRMADMISKLMQLIRDHKEPFVRMFDPGRGLMAGDLNVVTLQPIPGRYKDRFVEDRAALAFVIALYDLPREAWSNIPLQIQRSGRPWVRDYTDPEGNVYPVLTAFDGGSFQFFYNPLSGYELGDSSMRLLLRNTAIRFLRHYDESNSISYFPGAAYVGSADRYVAKAGLKDLAETADTLEPNFIAPSYAFLAVPATSEVLNHMAGRVDRPDLRDAALGHLPWESFTRNTDGTYSVTPVHSSVLVLPALAAGGLLKDQDDFPTFYRAVDVHGIPDLEDRIRRLYSPETLRIQGTKLVPAPPFPAPRSEVRRDWTRRQFLGTGAVSLAMLLGMGIPPTAMTAEQNVQGTQESRALGDPRRDVFYILQAVQGKEIHDISGKPVTESHRDYVEFQAKIAEDGPVKGFLSAWWEGIHEDSERSKLTPGRGYRIAKLIEDDADRASALSGHITEYFREIGILKNNETLREKMYSLIYPQGVESFPDLRNLHTPEEKDRYKAWIDIISRLIAMSRSMFEDPASAICTDYQVKTSDENKKQVEDVARYFHYVIETHKAVVNIARERVSERKEILGDEFFQLLDEKGVDRATFGEYLQIYSKDEAARQQAEKAAAQLHQQGILDIDFVKAWYQVVNHEQMKATYPLYRIIRKRDDERKGLIGKDPAQHERKMEREFPAIFYEGLLFSTARDLGAFGVDLSPSVKSNILPYADLPNFVRFLFALRDLQDKRVLLIAEKESDSSFVMNREIATLQYLATYISQLQEIGFTVPEEVVKSVSPCYNYFLSNKTAISDKWPTWLVGGQPNPQQITTVTGILTRVQAILESGKNRKLKMVDAADRLVPLLQDYIRCYPDRLRQTEASGIARGIRRNIAVQYVLQEYYQDRRQQDGKIIIDQFGKKVMDKVNKLDAAASNGEGEQSNETFDHAEQHLLYDASKIVILLERLVDRDTTFYGRPLDAEGVSKEVLNILQGRFWLVNPADSDKFSFQQLREALLRLVQAIEDDDLLKRTVKTQVKDAQGKEKTVVRLDSPSSSLIINKDYHYRAAAIAIRDRFTDQTATEDLQKAVNQFAQGRNLRNASKLDTLAEWVHAFIDYTQKSGNPNDLRDFMANLPLQVLDEIKDFNDRHTQHSGLAEIVRAARDKRWTKLQEEGVQSDPDVYLRQPFFTIRNAIKDEMTPLPRVSIDEQSSFFPELHLQEGADQGILPHIRKVRKDLEDRLGDSGTVLAQAIFRDDWVGHLESLKTWHSLRRDLGRTYDAQERLLSRSVSYNHGLENFLVSYEGLLVKLRRIAAAQKNRRQQDGYLLDLFEVKSFLTIQTGLDGHLKIYPKPQYAQDPFVSEMAQQLLNIDSLLRNSDVLDSRKSLQNIQLKDIQDVIDRMKTQLETAESDALKGIDQAIKVLKEKLNVPAEELSGIEETVSDIKARLGSTAREPSDVQRVATRIRTVCSNIDDIVKRKKMQAKAPDIAVLSELEEITKGVRTALKLRDSEMIHPDLDFLHFTLSIVRWMEWHLVEQGNRNAQKIAAALGYVAALAEGKDSLTAKQESLGRIEFVESDPEGEFDDYRRIIDRLDPETGSRDDHGKKVKAAVQVMMQAYKDDFEKLEEMVRLNQNLRIFSAMETLRFHYEPDKFSYLAERIVLPVMGGEVNLYYQYGEIMMGRGNLNRLDELFDFIRDQFPFAMGADSNFQTVSSVYEKFQFNTGEIGDLMRILLHDVFFQSRAQDMLERINGRPGNEKIRVSSEELRRMQQLYGEIYTMKMKEYFERAQREDIEARGMAYQTGRFRVYEEENQGGETVGWGPDHMRWRARLEKGEVVAADVPEEVRKEINLITERANLLFTRYFTLEQLRGLIILRSTGERIQNRKVDEVIKTLRERKVLPAEVLNTLNSDQVPKLSPYEINGKIANFYEEGMSLGEIRSELEKWFQFMHRVNVHSMEHTGHFLAFPQIEYLYLFAEKTDFGLGKKITIPIPGRDKPIVIQAEIYGPQARLDRRFVQGIYGEDYMLRRLDPDSEVLRQSAIALDLAFAGADQELLNIIIDGHRQVKKEYPEIEYAAFKAAVEELSGHLRQIRNVLYPEYVRQNRTDSIHPVLHEIARRSFPMILRSKILKISTWNRMMAYRNSEEFKKMAMARRETERGIVPTLHAANRLRREYVLTSPDPDKRMKALDRIFTFVGMGQAGEKGGLEREARQLFTERQFQPDESLQRYLAEQNWRYGRPGNEVLEFTHRHPIPRTGGEPPYIPTSLEIQDDFRIFSF